MTGGSLSRTVTSQQNQQLVTSNDPENATEARGVPNGLSNLFGVCFLRLAALA